MHRNCCDHVGKGGNSLPSPVVCTTWSPLGLCRSTLVIFILLYQGCSELYDGVMGPVSFLLSCRGTIWNLYSVPRIVEPVWLTMMSSTLEKTQVCQRFLKEFTLLIEHINKNQ